MRIRLVMIAIVAMSAVCGYLFADSAGNAIMVLNDINDDGDIGDDGDDTGEVDIVEGIDTVNTVRANEPDIVDPVDTVNAVNTDDSVNTVNTVNTVYTDNTVYIRGIEIYGNVKTREDVLTRFFAFKLGEPLDTSKIRVTRERLRATRLYDKVDIFPHMREDGAHIFVILKESVRLQIGYGGTYYTHRHGAEDLWVRISADVTLENFRGRMEAFAAGVSLWDYKSVDLAWYKPFLATPYYVSFSAGVAAYPEIILPLNYVDVFATAAAGRSLSERSRLTLSATPIYRRRTVAGVGDADSLIPQDFRNELYEAFAAAAFTVDSRNARFDPRSGWFLSSQLRTNRLYSGVNTPFFQLTNEFRYYVPLLFGDMAALRLRLTLRDVDAGAYHRLVYGGAGEIRGYGDDALGWRFRANSSILASVKYHKRLYKTPQLPMPLVNRVFSGVNALHFRFDAAFIADYAGLYGDPLGAVAFSGRRQDGAGIGAGIRILAPEVRQSGCIDLVFGMRENAEGGYRWEPTLHLYLDLFY